MVKRIKKSVKNRPTRERKKIIVVGTEGDNKTEELYLRFIEKKQSRYRFLFAPGNETDPENIVHNTAKKAKEEELSYKNGDMAISIFDLDLDLAKEGKLKKAKESAASKGIILCTSNPCFEVWFIEHFGYTSKPFTSSSEVVKCLKKLMPDYCKNLTDYEQIYARTQNAVANCMLLAEHHMKDGAQNLQEFNNPQTEVYKLIQILEKGDDNRKNEHKN